MITRETVLEKYRTKLNNRKDVFKSIQSSSLSSTKTLAADIQELEIIVAALEYKKE